MPDPVITLLSALLGTKSASLDTAILAVPFIATSKIAPSSIASASTESSAGWFKVTVEPTCTINTESLVAKLAPNIIVLLSTSAKPSVGADVPVLALCTTPLILTINWAALLTLAAEPELLPSLKSYVAILPSIVGAPLPPAGHKKRYLKSPVDVMKFLSLRL